MRQPFSFFLTLILLFLTFSAANAEKRVALVIGNGAYKNVPKLPNPANDASDVATALARSGFEVIFETNLDQLGMQNASYALRVRRVLQTLHCSVTAATLCSLRVSITWCLSTPSFEMKPT